MDTSFDASVRLDTPHLTLRNLRYSDANGIFRNIANDRDVLRYYIMNYSDDRSSFSLEGTVDYFARSKRYGFAIVEKDSGEVIGMIHQCSSADEVFRTTEIGYALGKRYWNRGYMTEALGAVIDFLFSKGIHKVICTHIVENTASGRVMQKCGMIPEEGIRKEELFYGGSYRDLKVYYKLNSDT